MQTEPQHIWGKILFNWSYFVEKKTVNSMLRSAKLSTSVIYRNSVPDTPHLLPVSRSPFNRNSSLLRWAEASMLCNPTLYPSWKKTWREEARYGLADLQRTANTQACSELAVTQKKHSRLPRKIHIATCRGQCRTRATISDEKHSSICHGVWECSAAATDTWLGSAAGNSHKEHSTWKLSITSM